MNPSKEKKVYYDDIRPCDIRDPLKLRDKLLAGSSPLASIVSERVPKALATKLCLLPPHATETSSLVGSLIEALTLLAQGSPLPYEGIGQGINLSQRTRDLSKWADSAEGALVRQFNRSMLEDYCEHSMRRSAVLYEDVNVFELVSQSGGPLHAIVFDDEVSEGFGRNRRPDDFGGGQWLREAVDALLDRPEVGTVWVLGLADARGFDWVMNRSKVRCGLESRSVLFLVDLFAGDVLEGDKILRRLKDDYEVPGYLCSIFSKRGDQALEVEFGARHIAKALQARTPTVFRSLHNEVKEWVESTHITDCALRPFGRALDKLIFNRKRLVLSGKNVALDGVHYPRFWSRKSRLFKHVLAEAIQESQGYAGFVRQLCASTCIAQASAMQLFRPFESQEQSLLRIAPYLAKAISWCHRWPETAFIPGYWVSLFFAGQPGVLFERALPCTGKNAITKVLEAFTALCREAKMASFILGAGQELRISLIIQGPSNSLMELKTKLDGLESMSVRPPGLVVGQLWELRQAGFEISSKRADKGLTITVHSTLRVLDSLQSRK